MPNPDIWGEKGTVVNSFIYTVFHTNSDLNIFGNYFKYIRITFFTNILENKYEQVCYNFEDLELFPRLF